MGIAVLAALARRLNRDAGAPPIPALYFLTDPARTPDPARIAERLPNGTAVIYRHFGASDRFETARRLARISRARGLVLLIAADPALAAEIGAHGVHWPERLMPANRDGFALETAAAHSVRALARAAAAGFDAALLGPVLPSRSPTAARPLGPRLAGHMARSATLPVIALGGLDAQTGRRLIGRGFAGLAAVEAFGA
jgi:thiamine-phosphate pyrophosphorylase